MESVFRSGGGRRALQRGCGGGQGEAYTGTGDSKGAAGGVRDSFRSCRIPPSFCPEARKAQEAEAAGRAHMIFWNNGGIY